MSTIDTIVHGAEKASEKTAHAAEKASEKTTGAVEKTIEKGSKKLAGPPKHEVKPDPKDTKK